MKRIVTVLAAVVLGLGAATSSAAAWEDEGSGPALSVPAADLRASLACHGDLAKRTPVLLVPGTALTPAEFDWNYVRAFTATGRPFCTVTLPQRALGDIQVGAEYVVNAVRTMAEKAGGKIDVVGHSQGGMQPRWALRFWPDTRRMVADQVGIAAAHHGAPPEGLATLFPAAIFAGCDLRGCFPAAWQLRPGSQLLRALNSRREMVAPVSWTSIYSTTDEVVAPSSTVLHGPAGPGGYRRVALQDVCPGRIADHLTDGTTDPVAFALVLDAIEHRGPADPARIDRRVCGQAVIDHLDPVGALARAPSLLGGIAAGALLGTPAVPREPALPCYVRADCSAGAGRTR